MYVNGKMRPTENIPGLGEGRRKKNGGGVNSTVIHLIYCKNFCKCHNIPQAQSKKKVGVEGILGPFYLLIGLIQKEGKLSSISTTRDRILSSQTLGNGALFSRIIIQRYASQILEKGL
jgi:hypothetical protein